MKILQELLPSKQSASLHQHGTCLMVEVENHSVSSSNWRNSLTFTLKNESKIQTWWRWLPSGRKSKITVTTLTLTKPTPTIKCSVHSELSSRCMKIWKRCKLCATLHKRPLSCLACKRWEFLSTTATKTKWLEQIPSKKFTSIFLGRTSFLSRVQKDWATACVITGRKDMLLPIRLRVSLINIESKMLWFEAKGF